MKGYKVKCDFICILLQIEKFRLYMGENEKEEMNKLLIIY